MPAAPTAGRSPLARRARPRSVSLAVSPRRDRRAPYRFRSSGRVALPHGLTRRQACGAGTVAVQVKAGRRTVSARRAHVRADCTYRSTVAFRARRRLGRGRLTVRARFSGNRVLLARHARARRVRAGVSR